MNELNDKVAIITGGCGGIGLATVKAFLAEGARVMLVDLDGAKVEQAVKSLDSSRVKGFPADVSKAEQTAAYVSATVEAFGGLDILYANAGIEGLVRPIKDYPEAEFDKVLSVNVKGAFLGMKECVPHLEKRGGGSIVVTASIAAVVGSPGMAAYIVSKHALVGLVKVAAIEFGPLGIRVNAIAPGPVDNRMMRSLEEQSAPGKAETVKAGFTAQVPMGRYAKNEEIAQMALFLAGPRSSYSTGAVFLADGGFVTH